MRHEMVYLKNLQALERERLRIAHDINDDLGRWSVTQIAVERDLAGEPGFSRKRRAHFDRISPDGAGKNWLRRFMKRSGRSIPKTTISTRWEIYLPVVNQCAPGCRSAAASCARIAGQIQYPARRATKSAWR